MKFTVTHARAFVGNNIHVVVEADPKEGIRAIDIVLDGDSLASGPTGVATECYQQDFSAVGEAGAGVEHTLTVTATDNRGVEHGSTTRWVDAM